MNKKVIKLLHVFGRFSPWEKWFIIYSGLLILTLLFSPIISITPLNSTSSTSFFLINGYFTKINFLVLSSRLVLFLWNMSYQFKNFFIGIFGLRDNEYLINFGLLRIMTTSLLSIGETISLVKWNFTYTINLTQWYYFVVFLLIGWLLYSLILTIQQAKKNNKINIVNIVKEQPQHDNAENILKGLFGKEVFEPNQEQSSKHNDHKHSTNL
jgi:hypothetical protein